MELQVCPACSVRLSGDTVLWSTGKLGTRAQLAARVCCYAKKPGCINHGVAYSEGDGYGGLPDWDELQAKIAQKTANNLALESEYKLS